MDPSQRRLRRLATSDLTPAERTSIRALLDAAFDHEDPDERFSEDDWQHALGGTHVVLDLDGEIVAHASVVPRDLRADGRSVRTGYVEAVATVPARHGQSFGTIVMKDVGDLIRDGFELGALGTGAYHFYERLGWTAWRGPTAVRTDDGERRTPGDDGFILVLRTPTTPTLDDTGPISCDWRPGDVW